MANIAGYPSAIVSGSPGKSGRINMANLAGYPSAVISGSPGKSGRIQGTFNPLSLSNIVGWWDAAQGVMLNGSDVSQWNDQSINANNLVQTTGTKQPLLVDPGGVPPFVRFDQTTSESMRTGVFAGGNIDQPNTFLLVAQKRSGGDASYLFDGLTTFLRNAVADFGGFGMFASDILIKGPIDQVKRIFVCIFDSGSGKFYFDGGVGASGSVGVASTDGLSLCARFNDASFGDYDVWEITVYNKRLTIPELNQLGVFLANKHSLTWTTITA